MCSMFNLYSKKPKILSREMQKLILDVSTLLLVSSYTNTTPPAQPTNKNSLPIALTTTRIFRPSASFINFLTQVLTQHPCWLRLTAVRLFQLHKIRQSCGPCHFSSYQRQRSLHLAHGMATACVRNQLIGVL